MHVFPGSDHTPFAAHAGIASLIIGVEPAIKDYYSIYHSVYDSFDWMQNYGDPGFGYHQALGRVLGTLAINVASELVRNTVGTVCHACRVCTSM
jgi:N-acetylated-alpha-linked acidic dipeptidase